MYSLVTFQNLKIAKIELSQTVERTRHVDTTAAHQTK